MEWCKCPKLAQPGCQFPKCPSETQSCCGIASRQTHQFKGNESGANLCPNWGLSSPWIKQSQLSSSLQEDVHKKKLCLTHPLVLRVNNETAKAKLIDSINLNLPNKIWQFQKKGKWAISGREEGYGTRSSQRQFASVVILWEAGNFPSGSTMKLVLFSVLRSFKKEGRIWWNIQKCSWHWAFQQIYGPSQMEMTCRPFKKHFLILYWSIAD